MDYGQAFDRGAGQGAGNNEYQITNMLSVFDLCLRSRHYVNVVVAGKHALPQWLSMDAAVVHCTEGIGIYQ
jgi:phosphoketolase